MKYNSEYLMISKSKLIFYIVSVTIFLSSLMLFPFHRIKSNESADNPKQCPYYITLNSILANSRMLAVDNANNTLIKSRFIQFENDLVSSKKPLITSEFSNKYSSLLQLFGVNSVNKIKSKNQMIAFARSAAGLVDDYYLDERVACNSPLYYWMGSHSRRILQYNFGGMYDAMPNLYSRILVAFPNDSQLGVFSGFFVNNQTTALETQFTTGMPMLTALYVLPKYDYSKVGGYFAMVPWGYFNVDTLDEPTIRKVLDVSGIDIFTILKSQMSAKKIDKIVDTHPISSNIKAMFGGDAQSLVNTRSYGMAYLANHVIYEKKSDIAHYEDIIRGYFSNSDNRNPKIFTAATSVLYDKLLSLDHYKDIILEKNQPIDLDKVNVNSPAGSVLIRGIVGERAMFDAQCLRSHCTFVLNVSDAPGWMAFVNGRQESIARANFAFMSVDVPAGKSKVWFVYAPWSNMISYFVSIIMLIYILIIGQYKKETLE